MTDRDEEFQKRLLATFKTEAEDHLVKLASGLVDLEGSDDQEARSAIIETIFREAHSLKGAARAVNITRVESFCQALETLLAAMKRKEIALFAELFDLLQQSVDFLRELLEESAGADRGRDQELIRRLEGAAKGEHPAGRGAPPAAAAAQLEPALAAHPVPPETAQEAASQAQATPGKGSAAEAAEGAPQTPAAPTLRPTSETVKVATSRLTTVLLQAEEMLAARLSISQRAADLRGVSAAFNGWKKQWAKLEPLVENLCQPESQRQRHQNSDAHLLRLCEFLQWTASFVEDVQERCKQAQRSTERDGRVLGGMINNLLEEMKKVLMLPFSSLLEIFPKMVRDLARARGKDAALSIQGGEIEIDRRILDELKDPLVHLVRNCVDHGIETSQEREAAGKEPRATVSIVITPKDGSKVEVMVADDGKGVDLAGLRSAVRAQGLLSAQRVEELSVEQLLPYLFLSGVSTSAVVSDISGRGLGLAIVREKVEKLSGSVSVESTPGGGTAFRMLLPLTVSSFRVILIRLGDELYAFPAAHVEQVTRVTSSEIVTAEGKEMMRHKGRALPLVRLGAVLGIAGASMGERLQVVLATVAEKAVGFLVDEVLNEQEVLAKNLGMQISRLPNVTGATILGSGRVVPILNVSDLLSASSSERAREAPGPQPHGEKKRGLVAEDSITSRTLLKNILEGAGYQVATAVDGLDAFTQLKNGEFDFVVSDVEMPRMTGLDLTAKIRADRELADLPVILVTALDSPADRERGMDVGASAYLVKSRFDQSNLLEAIRRLV